MLEPTSMFYSTLGVTTLSRTVKTGKYVYEGKEFHKDRLAKVAGSSIVTGATTTALTSYSLSRQAKYKVTASYIESLNDDQLYALEQRLENKDIDLDSIMKKNSPKVLKKTL